MISEKTHRLDIRLHDIHVGEMLLRGNNIRFMPDGNFLQQIPRPVLGQTFEDDPARIRSTHQRLTPWFSNLLPEKAGPLREMVARQLGVHPEREFFLLAGLGHDLPGAVTVHLAEEESTADVPAENPDDSESFRGVRLKFSLAGVQLKLSMLRGRRGLTFPASGEGGDWIAKLPFHDFRQVPENEYSMMTWLKESGADVPAIELIPAQDVHGIPDGLVDPGTKVFAIERFDRTPQGRRHIEDFAQILDLYPEQKYQKANYETIGRILLSLSGEEAVREFVRRLVAAVLMGNGDAHLKNWSLLYTADQKIRLSPAYDFVSTVVYQPFRADTLALNLDRSKQFSDITPDSFRRLGERIGYPRPEELASLAAEFVEIMRSTWSRLAKELPLSRDMGGMINERLTTLPLACMN
ncbi:type II toxin-antitoxin system HipA family toxin [Actinoplanes sp. NPDC026670]|uniref:type II toxin-antitoxin system HipA family toxin n=1 Tax=Actinoplanes sp. NPDC026670 TaxID=3154700 RepID=UPI0033D10568